MSKPPFRASSQHHLHLSTRVVRSQGVPFSTMIHGTNRSRTLGVRECLWRRAAPAATDTPLPFVSAAGARYGIILSSEKFIEESGGLMREPGRIAIDGPAGSGKSTIGEQLARQLGYLYIDTGAMYRAVTWLALREGVDINDGPALGNLARRARVEINQPRIADGRQYTVT